jgi:hypothetical protein
VKNIFRGDFFFAAGKQLNYHLAELYNVYTWTLETDMRIFWCKFILHQTPSVSVPDPDLNPDPDPYVFGPPGSGSGSFYQQAEIARKTLIPTGLLLLLDSSSLKNDANVPSKSNNQRNL